MLLSFRDPSLLAVIATVTIAVGIYSPVFVAGQTSCPGVCPDGSPVNAGLLLPSEPGAPQTNTCGDIDGFAKIGGLPCEQAVTFAAFCECPGLAFECRVCPAGQSLPANNTAFGSSCELLGDQQLFITDPASCSTAFHAQLKAACGDCVPRNTTGNVSTGNCTICPDGSPVSDVGGTLPGSPLTCSALDLALTPLDPSSCSDAVKSDGDFLQVFCECPGFQPSCTLCADGSDPLLSDTVLPGGITCGEFNSQIVTVNGTECTDITTSPYPAICGCGNTTIPAQNVTCDICSGGNLTNPEALVPFTDVSCSTLALTVAFSTNETECADVSNPFIQSLCGCTASDSQVCTICPDGSDPTNIDAVIPGAGFACGFYSLIVAGLNETECMEVQSSGIGAFCGCGVTGGCPGICPDGGPIAFPDLIPVIPGSPDDSNVTCAGLEFFLSFTNDTETCNAIQILYSEQCGCANPATPSCPLCEDGSLPPNPDLEFVPGGTCLEASLFLPFVSNSTECVASQATAGVYCGCMNNAASDQACRICGGTNLLPDPTRVAFIDEFGDAVACGGLEYEATVAPDTCNATQATFSDFCCAPFVCPGLCPDGGNFSNSNLTVTIPDDGTGNPINATCSDLNTFLLTQSPTADECFGLQFGYADACGCAVSPTTNCTLCEDGSPVGLPDLVISGDGGTCVDVESSFADSFGSFECTTIQAVAGAYCGCNNTITSGLACRLCGDNNLLPDAGRFALTENGEIISCGQVEYEATVNASACGVLRDQFASSCCTELVAPVTNAPVMSNMTMAPVMSNMTMAPVMSNMTMAPVMSNMTMAPVMSNMTMAPVMSNATMAPVMPNATMAPVTGAPVTMPNATMAPVTGAPVTMAPATPAPVTGAPVTTAPVTPAPVTGAPVTTAPVTPAPVPVVTPAPVTGAPTSGAISNAFFGAWIFGTLVSMVLM